MAYLLACCPPINMVIFTFSRVKHPISLFAAHCTLHRLLEILQGTKLTKVMTTPTVVVTHSVMFSGAGLVHSLSHYRINKSLSAEETSKWQLIIFITG